MSNSQNSKKTIDVDNIDKICALAMLSLSDAEKSKLIEDINSTLVFFQQLRSIDTDGMDRMPYFPHDNLNVQREDTVGEPLCRDRLLAEAPDSDGEYITVPLVISGEDGK